jgi:hypothetical protein
MAAIDSCSKCEAGKCDQHTLPSIPFNKKRVDTGCISVEPKEYVKKLNRAERRALQRSKR